MTYSFRTGDQCTTQALSQQEEKVVETERLSAHILWRLLTILDGAIVLHTCLSRLRGREALIIAVYLKSCFVVEKPIIGSGTNSCFHHRLKGRKLLNKEEVTGLKGGHCGVLKLDLSLLGLLLEPLEIYSPALIIHNSVYM